MAIRRRTIVASCLYAWLAGATTLVHAQTVLITGSNTGIGLEFVKQYAAKGWTVIATHRRDVVPDTLKAVADEHANIRIERTTRRR